MTTVVLQEQCQLGAQTTASSISSAPHLSICTTHNNITGFQTHFPTTTTTTTTTGAMTTNTPNDATSCLTPRPTTVGGGGGMDDAASTQGDSHLDSHTYGIIQHTVKEAETLNNLSPQLQDLLKKAACLGNRFSVTTIQVILQVTDKRVRQLLQELVEHQLITPIIPQPTISEMTLDSEVESKPAPSQANMYRFVHDSVQQASYDLMSEDECELMHLTIGRLLLAATPNHDLSTRVNEIVDQFNMASSNPILMHDPLEMRRVIELNVMAARKAITIISYESALNFLQLAIAMMRRLHKTPDEIRREEQEEEAAYYEELDMDQISDLPTTYQSSRSLLGQSRSSVHWQTDYELASNVYRLAAETSHLSNEYALCNTFLEEALLHARTVEDRISLLQIRMRSETVQSHCMKSAVATGIEILKLQGLDISVRDGFLPTSTDATRPPIPQPVDLQTFLASTEHHPETMLTMQELTDPVVIPIMHTLSSIVSILVLSKGDLYSQMTAIMLAYSYACGTSLITAMACVNVSTFLRKSLQIDLADAYGRVAGELMDRTKAALQQNHTNNAVIGGNSQVVPMDLARTTLAAAAGAPISHSAVSDAATGVLYRKILAIFHSHVSCWVRLFSHSINDVSTACTDSLLLGDTDSYCMLAFISFGLKLLCGRPYRQLYSELTVCYQELLSKRFMLMASRIMILIRCVQHYLNEASETFEFDEREWTDDEFIMNSVDDGAGIMKFRSLTVRAFIFYQSRKFDEAKKRCVTALDFLTSTWGSGMIPFFNFNYALTLLQFAKTLPDDLEQDDNKSTTTTNTSSSTASDAASAASSSVDNDSTSARESTSRHPCSFLSGSTSPLSHLHDLAVAPTDLTPYLPVSETISAYLEVVGFLTHPFIQWAQRCPGNYLLRLKLLEAETYCVLVTRRGQKQHILAAMNAYDAAIEAAHQYSWTHEEALGNELAGRFYHAIGRKQETMRYLKRAYQGYQMVNCVLKTEQLYQEFHDVFVKLDQQGKLAVRANLYDDASTVNSCEAPHLTEANVTFTAPIEFTTSELIDVSTTPPTTILITTPIPTSLMAPRIPAPLIPPVETSASTIDLKQLDPYLLHVITDMPLYLIGQSMARAEWTQFYHRNCVAVGLGVREWSTFDEFIRWLDQSCSTRTAAPDAIPPCILFDGQRPTNVQLLIQSLTQYNHPYSGIIALLAPFDPKQTELIESPASPNSDSTRKKMKLFHDLPSASSPTAAAAASSSSSSFSPDADDSILLSLTSNPRLHLLTLPTPFREIATAIAQAFQQFDSESNKSVDHGMGITMDNTGCLNLTSLSSDSSSLLRPRQTSSSSSGLLRSITTDFSHVNRHFLSSSFMPQLPASSPTSPESSSAIASRKRGAKHLDEESSKEKKEQQESVEGRGTSAAAATTNMSSNKTS